MVGPRDGCAMCALRCHCPQRQRRHLCTSRLTFPPPGSVCHTRWPWPLAHVGQTGTQQSRARPPAEQRPRLCPLHLLCAQCTRRSEHRTSDWKRNMQARAAAGGDAGCACPGCRTGAGRHWLLRLRAQGGFAQAPSRTPHRGTGGASAASKLRSLRSSQPSLR